MKINILHIRNLKFIPDKTKEWNKVKNPEKSDVILNLLNSYMGGKRFTQEYVYELCQIRYSWNIILKYSILFLIAASILYYWLIIPVIILFFIKKKIKKDMKHYIDVYFGCKNCFSLEDNWQTTKSNK